MPTSREWLLSHVVGDHERLLERLHSLDRALETISRYGKVHPPKRGFGGLRLRCLELQETLRVHIPAEEKLFAQLEGKPEWRPLLERLQREHRAVRVLLEETLEELNGLASSEPPVRGLATLKDKVRVLSVALQDHIATENRTVLRLLAAD